jgi:hypothetical protein
MIARDDEAPIDCSCYKRRMGDPDKLNLQTELERAGWRVQRHAGADWWMHEIWELASAWRPTDAHAFLTLLIDPQASTTGIGDVWAIAVTPERPADRMEADRSAIRVRPRWPERMKEIVLAAAGLRGS